MLKRTIPGFGISSPLDPQQSANAGAQYLAQLYAQYGNWNTALIAYNQGPGALAANGPYSSSQAYAASILANAGLPSDGSGAGTPVDASTGLPVTNAGVFDASSLFTSSATPAVDNTSVDSSTFSFTDGSGNLTPVAWVGIAAAGLLGVFAFSR